MKTILSRVWNSTRTAIPKALRTSGWLLKIILPVGLAVSVLQYVGVIAGLASLLNPLFALIGLPGESAVVFISSVFLNIYAAIAVIATLPLAMREITILALMCLISHNMFVETAIQKKTGSSALAMLLLRLAASFAGALVLNAVLPDHLGPALAAQKSVVFETFWAMLADWFVNALGLIIKITLIIIGLMILQNILQEFKILGIISRICAPLMRLLGLSRETSFLWFVAQTLGLAYGSAVMIEAFEHGDIRPAEADLLNYHVAINHSLLEDTLLFVAIGVPALWITFPRVFLAAAVVWGVRGVKSLKMTIS
jgi:spore maturation protein SpmB